jgi:hypothetical protein
VPEKTVPIGMHLHINWKRTLVHNVLIMGPGLCLHCSRIISGAAVPRFAPRTVQITGYPHLRLKGRYDIAALRRSEISNFKASYGLFD